MNDSAKKSLRQRWRDLPQHTVIWLILALELFPFYMMLQISMKDNAGFLANLWLPAWPQDWQWANYAAAAQLMLPYVANTVVVAVSGSVGCVFLALLAAYFFARYKMPFSNVLWAAFLVLMLLPGVANIVTLFNLLKSLSLLNTLWALIILAISGGQVFCLFVLRNFIEDLPKDLFEAAEMDGASHFAQLVNIVIPMSGPIIGTLFLLQFLGLIYLDGEYVKQWGQIMAAFFMASLPIIIIFLFTMKLFVRGLSSGALKG
jgi:multiple sugar transport system permease protein